MVIKSDTIYQIVPVDLNPRLNEREARILPLLQYVLFCKCVWFKHTTRSYLDHTGSLFTLYCSIVML